MRAEAAPDPFANTSTTPVRRNLVMVARRSARFAFDDFCQVAAHCRAIAPDIRPLVLFDAPSSMLRIPLSPGRR
jgi:hypothetical protein